MQYSLSHSLKGAPFATSNVNPAEAYVAAVVAAGATVSAGQEAAVDTFFRAAKSGGYYSSLKRLYLPIWGVAAANAIDMITLASGTFSGSVTHAAGYVQGDGATGYFDMGVSFVGAGLTQNSSSAGFIAYAGHTLGGFRAAMGDGGGVDALVLFNFPNAGDTGFYANSSGYDGAIINATTGVFVGSRTSSSSVSLTRRHSGGEQTNTNAAATSIGHATGNIYAMTSGATGWFSDAKLGAYFIGTTLNTANRSSLASSMRFLWETCTGLTLP